MNQLVFVEKDQVVTDSLIVAEVFGKGHDKVLRDIREMECSEEFRLTNFGESSYVNSQNKEMPMFYMNKKAFTLLAMGYTGKEAMKYKEAYINEFERMEDELKSPRILTEKEQLMASMKLSLETAGEIATVKEDIAEIKHQIKNKMTVDHSEQLSIQNAVKSRVESIAPNYEMDKRKIYSQIHTHLRRAFVVPSYRDVKQKDFNESINWIKAWRPLI